MEGEEEAGYEETIPRQIRSPGPAPGFDSEIELPSQVDEPRTDAILAIAIEWLGSNDGRVTERRTDVLN